MYRHVQETKTVCFALLYKRKLPFCSLCIILHGLVSRWVERKDWDRVSDRSMGEHYSDLGLLNLLLAVSSLNDVGISNGADMAVMLSD